VAGRPEIPGVAHEDLVKADTDPRRREQREPR
jgi:hypothetical protein